MLEQYYTKKDQQIFFTSQQASDFAKQIAQDFNPLHNKENKRFCVPGDLMFAIVLAEYGMSQHMHFSFEGMLKGDTDLDFPDFKDNTLILKDEKEKPYLTINRAGNISTDMPFIENFICEYVAFSGQTFPQILVPLMRKEGLMINPMKPLVIYENMEINLDEFSAHPVSLECLKTKLDIKGKRGNVTLEFCVKTQGKIIGTGEKHLIIGGLRDFKEEAINDMIAIYHNLKQQYQTESKND